MNVHLLYISGTVRCHGCESFDASHARYSTGVVSHTFYGHAGVVYHLSTNMSIYIMNLGRPLYSEYSLNFEGGLAGLRDVSDGNC